MRKTSRKNIALLAVLLPAMNIAYSQIPQDLVLSTYSNQTVIEATRSVTLKPGFYIPAPAAGVTRTIRIVGEPMILQPDGAQNYILHTSYLQGTGGSSSAERMQDVQYFDGLGRPVQSVQGKAGAGYRDIVGHQSYDAFGRADRSYLPYAAVAGSNGKYRPAAVAEQAAFYNTAPAGVVKIPVAGAVTPSFGRPVYEASPLNRVLEQGFAGQAWQPGVRGATTGRTVVTEYTANNITPFATLATTRMAALYRVSLAADGTPTLTLAANAVYGANELYVTVTKDENWISADGRVGTTEEYTDKQGRVVLKRTFNKNAANVTEMLSTYYVYDDFGNLSYVLTPGAAPDRGALPAAGTALTDWLSANCYQYRYDERNRPVEKQLPGKGREYIVYNGLDQVVATQDAVQRTRHEWTVTKYDGLGRVALTGLWNNGAAAISRANLQAQVKAVATLWETRNGTAGNGYTNVAWPITAIGTTLSLHYYDNYNLPLTPPAAYKPAGYSTATQGLPTATLTKVLGAGTGTANMLWEVLHYDALGQVARIFRQHYKGAVASAANYDDITNTYTFPGNVEKSIRRHYAGAATAALTVTTDYVYDHRNRLLDTWKTVNTGTRTLMARNEYNEVGQLKRKNLHSTDNGSSFAQAVHYRYNQRGWLVADSSALFTQQLRYNDAPAGVKAQYNGNISYQQWRRGTESYKGYSYSYDGLSRLVQGTLAGNLRKEYLRYDLMGNITRLGRTGSTSAQVDTLSYVYAGGRLTGVTDGSSSAEGAPQGAMNYTYDGNGNMQSRLNTTNAIDNISSIAYNHLNLPQTVTVPTGTLNYTYDGSGRKLRRVIGTEATDYVDGIQYRGTAIDFIQTEEGRIYNSNGAYVYEYTLKDHLGNARVSFDINNGAARKIQHDDYYPFGLTFDSYVSGTKNNYLYNGKELQDKLKQYDYGARFYDPVIGRWGSVDPMAEAYSSYSSYAYVGNDPILFHDPNGMYSVDANGNITIDDSKEISTFFDYLSNNSGASISDMSNHIISAGNGFSWELDAVTVAGRGAYESGSWLSGAQGRVSDAVSRMGNINSVTTANFGFENTKLALDIGGEVYGAFKSAVFPNGQWLGKNGNYYSASWGGNQYTGSRSGAYKAAGMYKWAGRAAVVASMLVGGVETYRGYQMDGGQFGYNAQKAAASSAGGLVGGIAGAKVGASAGAAFGVWFAGVGAVPGALIGGFVGGLIGSYTGSSVGERSVNYYYGR